MAKRHNIGTIAEVLIEKLDDLENITKQIEIVASKELKIDTSELNVIIQNQNLKERQILIDLKNLQEQNKSRFPNWVCYALTGIFILTFASFIIAFKYNEMYHNEKQRADIFEKAYIKMKNS